MECKLCKREMETAIGCSASDYTLKSTGSMIARIPYGAGTETKYITKESHPECHDCGAKWGFEHHPGCDMENCPICGEQLISCGHAELFREF